MRPPDPPPRQVDSAYLAELTELAVAHGIAHTGVCDAAPLMRARAEMTRRRAAGLHADMGFTYRDVDRATDPGRAVPGARAVFVGALPYAAECDDDPPVAAGRVARYAWTGSTDTLRDGLWAVARRLRADGYKAVVFVDDNGLVDREVAHRAAVGWFGKNANLLVPGAGSFVVLGSVVTTAPLPPAAAPLEDGCGPCRRCIAACPTGAILAPGVIDAGRCLAWVLQRPGAIPVPMRAAIGDRIYGCDDCQTACPPTVRVARRTAGGDHEPWVDVLDLLDATDEEILRRWGRWYIAGREARWVRRNALVVLGNVGAAADPRVHATLTRYCADPDEVLAEHARWAVQRLAQQVPA